MADQNFDLDAALTVAAECARGAGAIRQIVNQPHDIVFKGAIDVVTEGDKAAEAYIMERLLKAFPDHHFVGEEGGGYGAPKESAPFRWYIDPLDGTTNFAHSVPHFAVSIAMADAQDRPLVGAVYHPMMNELFTARKGGGAFLNGNPIHVSKVDDVGKSLIASGFPYHRRTTSDNNIEEWSAFIVRTQDLRRMGSAALDLAFVACGRFDGYWEQSINPWDVQAGLLLVTEAGGRITDYRGEDSELLYMGKRFVATNGLVHDRMLTIITFGDDAPKP